MFFSSAKSVDRDLSELLKKIDVLEQRIAEWEAELKKTVGSGLSTYDLLATVQEMHSIQQGMAIELRQMRLGIAMGAEQWRQALPLIKSAKFVVRGMTSHLDQMDAGAAHARAKFREKFR